MYPIFRPLTVAASRRMLVRPASMHTPTSIAALSTLSNSLGHPSAAKSKSITPFQRPQRSIIAHTVASTVSNRPTSQTFDHAALNIKGNSASDIAKTIAGRTSPVSDTSFLGITSSVASTVPCPILAFGLLGDSVPSQCCRHCNPSPIHLR